MPTVSKKSASSRENTSITVVRMLAAVKWPSPLAKAPMMSTRPSRPRSGSLNAASPGQLGTLSAHPAGLVVPSDNVAGTLTTACTIMASTVVAMMAMSIEPRFLRTYRNSSTSRPITKISTGQVLSEPLRPSCTGVPEPGVITWASTRPTKVTNRPMPTEIATRNSLGTARKTASRKPVSTRAVMMMPSTAIIPMARGHVVVGAIT